MRSAILLQKLGASVVYGTLLALFLVRRNNQVSDNVFWGSLAVICVFGIMHKLSTTTLNVAIDRDWVTIIAIQDSDALTRINTHLRRIDLLCKLLSPLFVSLLVSVASYVVSLAYIASQIFQLIASSLVCKCFLIRARSGWNDL